MNIFNSQKKSLLFLSFIDNKIYISTDGVTFNDIIFKYEFKIEGQSKEDELEIKVNSEYYEQIAKIKLLKYDY